MGKNRNRLHRNRMHIPTEAMYFQQTQIASDNPPVPMPSRRRVRIIDTMIRDPDWRRFGQHSHHFELEASACHDIQKLSMEPPSKWVHNVQSPFEGTLIEWPTFPMLQAARDCGMTVLDHGLGPEHVADSSGFMVYQNSILIVNTYAYETLRALGRKDISVNPFLIQPYVLRIDQGRDINDADQKRYEPYAYGLNYLNYTKEIPPFRLARLDRAFNDDPALTERMTRWMAVTPVVDQHEMLREFAGGMRTAIAVLAYLNSERHVEFAPAPDAKSSTFYKGKILKYPTTRLIVIRPDAIRRVYEREPYDASQGPMGVLRRHEVRRHMRTLKSGKRVPVREHERGNAALGFVQKRYIIERDPTKGNGPPHDD